MKLPPLPLSRVSLVISVLCAATVLPTASVTAQATPPIATGTQDAAVFSAPELGLRFTPPVGSVMRAEALANGMSYSLADSSTNPSWRMRVATIEASREGTTPATQIADYLALAKQSTPTLTVLREETLALAGFEQGASPDNRLLLVSVPLEGGGHGIAGQFVIARGEEQFLVFSLLADGPSFVKTEPQLLACFKTTVVRPLSDVAFEKLELLARGARLIARMDAAALRALTSDETRFYRVFKPVPNADDREIGYLSVRVQEGARGAIDPTRDTAKFEGDDIELGLLVTVDARAIVEGNAKHTVDVQSRYWLAWDSSSETWSVRSTERQGAAHRSKAQTGIRSAKSTGNPAPELHVINSSSQGMTREPSIWPVPPTYLSQAQTLLIGRLLPRDGSFEGEFAEYVYDARESRIPQRKETWKRSAQGWTLESRVAGNNGVMTQEFDAQGNRLKRVDIDGTITVAITPEALKSLWKSKGLPVK
ncbi:MAG: hypothetical protein EXS10_02520 [Phycisphaerales bacterium]|nr:hypothetical protein [Phycisphaerales bacterium]